MQPLLLFFLIIIQILLQYCLAAQVSSINTLTQSDSLNSSSELVSPNTNFTLGFYTPDNTNNTYLAVRLTFMDYPVWIGNRDKPVHRNSNPILTLDESGNLRINHTGGEPVQVYSSGMIRNNVSATLLDSGNFVVSEMKSSNLWESFDYPTDTLLPGMKLGTNHRTGRNWTITSWFNETNPAAGAFTMEWDPSVAQLLIRRRGVVYWMSGELKGSYWAREEGFDRFVYFKFANSSIHDMDVLRQSYDGVLRIQSNSFVWTVIDPSNCYGYKTKRSLLTQGCQLWHQPPCRNNRQKFVQRIGSFSGEVDYRSDHKYSNHSLSDCRDICWNDCECFAYYFMDDEIRYYGCQFVRGRNLKFEQNLDGTVSPMYIIITAPESVRL